MADEYDGNSDSSQDMGSATPPELSSGSNLNGGGKENMPCTTPTSILVSASKDSLPSSSGLSSRNESSPTPGQRKPKPPRPQKSSLDVSRPRPLSQLDSSPQATPPRLLQIVPGDVTVASRSPPPVFNVVPTSEQSMALESDLQQSAATEDTATLELHSQTVPLSQTPLPMAISLTVQGNMSQIETNISASAPTSGSLHALDMVTLTSTQDSQPRGQEMGQLSSVAVEGLEQVNSADVSLTSVQASQPPGEDLGGISADRAEGAEEVNPAEVSQNASPNSTNQLYRILYRLHCKDFENTKKYFFRYSWEPFIGVVDNKDEQKARQELAVMDVSYSISGTSLRLRGNQLRHNFGTTEDKDPDPFVVGVDFIARTQAATGIRIHSLHIRSVLDKLIQYYPGLEFRDKEFSLGEPFEILFLYWDELQRISEAFDRGNESVLITNPETGSEISIASNQITCDHLKVLLTSPPLDKVYREIYSPEKKLHGEGLATFNNLWLLFKPGEIVFTEIRGRPTGFVVMQVNYFSALNSLTPTSNPWPLDYWELLLWNLAYNDQKLKRQSHSVRIYRYNGEKNISDLSVFPTRYMKDQEAAKEELINRGKRYHRTICDDQRHMKYSGLVATEKPYFYQGDIIVDHRSYKLAMSDKSSTQTAEPQDCRGEPLFSKFNDMKCSLDNPLEPAQYLLLPGFVLGFALGKKQWAMFDMACVQEVSYDLNPMEYLIMDKANKDLILATAGSPREGTALKPWDAEWSADFVEGKGLGKVVLLHGPPGTGKTMTAECVAKYTKRPLVSLSAAYLGTSEGEMEARLVKWLDRAALWGAVILIDEAEVYLEQRQSKDISRNALVTAFLRTMEYFPGLIYLTTNGIGLFDEAVMSRIHLSIRYNAPTDEQRKDIWIGLFDKLARDQRNEKKARDEKAAKEVEHPRSTDVKDSEEVVPSPSVTIEESAQGLALGTIDKTYQDLKLNGREIRNVLLSAISVARHEAYVNLTDKSKPLSEIVVTAKHIESLLKNRTGFRQDYQLARGATTEQLAEESMIRAPDPE